MRKLYFVIILAVQFLACKKSNVDLSAKNPPLPDKDQLVSSVTFNYADGTYQETYTYDDLNRLTGMKTTVSGNASGEVSSHVYEYNQGNLSKSYITHFGLTSEVIYLYNNGIPSGVGYLNPAFLGQGYTITITTNGLTVTDYYKTTGNLDIYNIVKSQFSYNNGNKIQEINETLARTGDITSTVTTNYFYGTRNNPYSYSGSNWLLPEVPFKNKNELIKEVKSDNGVIITTLYTNTYNNKGYPTKVDADVTSPSGNSHYIITYQYIDAKLQ